MDDKKTGMQKLHELVSDVKVAMFTTTDDQGLLRARPMHTMQDGSDALFFFTREDTPKVEEVEKDATVCLAYSNTATEKYVSVSGTARKIRDRAEIKRFWKPVHVAWFPDGVDDPQLTLLKVTVEEGEYWDTPSSTVVQLVGMAKALLTGKSYAPGDNEKVHGTT